MVIQNPFTGEKQNSLHKTPRPFEPPDDIDYKIITMSKGDTIFYSGDLANSIYLLDIGRVKFCQFSSVGREIITRICGKNDLFGLEAFNSDYYQTSAVALCNSVVEIIPMSAFKVHQEEILDAFHKQYLEILEQYNHWHLPVKTKLACFLMRQARKYGLQKTDGWLEVELMLSHDEIGHCVNSSRTSISKSMDELKKIGFLTNVKRKTYQINLHQIQDSIPF